MTTASPEPAGANAQPQPPATPPVAPSARASTARRILRGAWIALLLPVPFLARSAMNAPSEGGALGSALIAGGFLAVALPIAALAALADLVSVAARRDRSRTTRAFLAAELLVLAVAAAAYLSPLRRW